MPTIAVPQPNGLVALFSTVSDGFVLVDATEDEAVEHLLEDARDQVRSHVRRQLENAADARVHTHYTFDVCLALHARHHGEDEADEIRRGTFV